MAAAPSFRPATAAVSTPTAIAGLYTDRLKQDNLSYRGVLSWTPIKDTLFYGSYTRGFKSGGFPTVFSVDQASLAPVVQERLDAYEVGAKLGLFDNRVQVNSAAFYYDYKNKQLLTYFSDPIFGNLQYLQNVPKSRVEGGEITATWLPIKNLNLTALGSYVRTKVIEFVGQTATGDDFDFAGRPFNYAPHLQGSLLANYTFIIDNSLNVSPVSSGPIPAKPTRRWKATRSSSSTNARSSTCASAFRPPASNGRSPPSSAT